MRGSASGTQECYLVGAECALGPSTIDELPAGPSLRGGRNSHWPRRRLGEAARACRPLMARMPGTTRSSCLKHRRHGAASLGCGRGASS